MRPESIRCGVRVPGRALRRKGLRLAPFIAPILTTLFNKAIDEQEYPDPLKTTKVIEIYKPKEKTKLMHSSQILVSTVDAFQGGERGE